MSHKVREFSFRQEWVDSAVLDEIWSTCAPVGNKKWKWTHKFGINMTCNEMKFLDDNSTYIFSMTDEDMGFYATRAYFILAACNSNAELVTSEDKNESN